MTLSHRVSTVRRMRTWLSCLLAIAVAAIIHRHIAAGDPDATRDWPEPALTPGLSDAQIGTAIADHARRLADGGYFSGVIVVTKAGKPIATAAHGLARIEDRTPNTVDTVFNIGSLTKDFTKVAIAQLAQAGKLSLDDSVAKHLAGTTIVGADRITIRQLLEHRSGMGDVFGAKYDAAPPSRLRELADFVPLFAGEPLAFEPGTSQRYSNAGYITLGLVIERVTGETYRDYVTKHIFAPAGMTKSGWWAVDERVPNRATGYTLHGSTDRTPNTKSLSGRPSSAGGTYATAGDIARFYDALLADKLLSAKWTSWMVNGSFDDARREPSIGVAGGAPGVNATVELDGPWHVVVLANFDPPSAMATARAVIEIIHGTSRGGRPMIRKRAPPGSSPTGVASPASP